MLILTREIHSIPADTLRQYLTVLGGARQPDGSVAGPQWQARFTPLSNYQMGRISFCSVRVELEGPADVVEQLMRQFDLRIMRPGG